MINENTHFLRNQAVRRFLLIARTSCSTLPSPFESHCSHRRAVSPDVARHGKAEPPPVRKPLVCDPALARPRLAAAASANHDISMQPRARTAAVRKNSRRVRNPPCQQPAAYARRRQHRPTTGGRSATRTQQRSRALQHRHRTTPGRASFSSQARARITKYGRACGLARRGRHAGPAVPLRSYFRVPPSCVDALLRARALQRRVPGTRRWVPRRNLGCVAFLGLAMSDGLCVVLKLWLRRPRAR